MRILILGGDGMLGHQLLRHLAPRHVVRVTLRQDLAAYERFGMFSPENAYAAVDLRVSDRLLAVLADFHPQVVINAAGVVKQRPNGQEHIANLEINALLPHRLALICQSINARLVHISTDCVFSGKRGHYTEEDAPDPVDVYGYSKLLGEVTDAGTITLRTSIIGTELSRRASLVEWFLAQQGTVKGYVNAVFSGFTTAELSRVIERIVVDFPDRSGIYHASSFPLTKHDLLVMLRDRLGLATQIVPDGEVRCDRSLDSRRFQADFQYAPPSWDAMTDELVRQIRERSR